jgi:hypothetical protein
VEQRGLTAEFCETQNHHQIRAAQTAGTSCNDVNPYPSAILRFHSGSYEWQAIESVSGSEECQLDLKLPPKTLILQCAVDGDSYNQIKGLEPAPRPFSV